MSRVLVPKVSREDGLLLKRIGDPNSKNAELVAGREDPTTWFWAAGGTVPKAKLDALVRRNLIELIDIISTEYERSPFSATPEGTRCRESWAGILYKARLTERGRATLVVFLATTDVIGRPLRRSG